MLSTVMLMAAGALGAPSVKVAAPTGLCITEAESPAAAVDRIALTGGVLVCALVIGDCAQFD